MPIVETDIKLMASQRLTDNDDGGGRMTGNEVVDGNVNNLFPDISRLDRVYGRVSMRKAFVAVQTDDQETYSGSHLILTNPAADPLVHVCMFTTANPHDERLAARDRIESYVTQGTRYYGSLWGNQLAGSRALLLFQNAGVEDTPAVGDVLYLVENEGAGGEYSQYVRVTEVENENITANISGQSVVKKMITVSIGDPLRYTFHGGELSNSDVTDFNASLYTTMVADAAKYYGAMRLTADIAKGDISLAVNSIFTHLVPSAQSEAPLLDVNPGEAGPVMDSGESRTVTVQSFVVADGAVFYFGMGMKPGTVTVTTNSHTYTDDGAGILVEGATVSGIVDYGLGTVTFESVGSWTSSCTVVAVVGSTVSRIANSLLTVVDINNRGYNFTKILNPPPSPGTLIVDYMSQGKWYRVRDKGNGELVPDISGTGTGTINYITGSCLLTCAALPDADTAILYGWGNPVEVESAAGLVTVYTAEVDHTVTDAPVAPNSFSVSWPSGGGTATVTDDGSGNLTGDGTGTINYATGRCLLKPTLLPAPDSDYTFDYDKYAVVAENFAVSVSGGILTGTLPQVPVKAGALTFLLGISLGTMPHVYEFSDDGAGNISATAWSREMGDYYPDWDGHLTISGLTGTVDYTTGDISIDATGVVIEALTFKPTLSAS